MQETAAGADNLGTLLWEWRMRRGLSLGRLAQLAGVHKSALSRWEAGLRVPRVQELAATLRALDVSVKESALAFACIPEPRALHYLKYTFASQTSSPLTRGDLLRAMRLRKGWTQAQTAAQIKVSAHTVARWEIGHRVPATEQLHTLCYALDAQEDELIALTTDRFTDAYRSEAQSWDEKAAQLVPLLNCGQLPELVFYLLDQELWRWSLRTEDARYWLLRLRIHHAHYNRLRLRWPLVEGLLNRAREAVSKEEMKLEQRLRYELLAARLAVYGGQRVTPERGARLLRAWLEPSRILPAFHAWILSDIAKYVAMQGDFESALLLATQSCMAAGIASHRMELWLRQCDYGTLLVEAGYPGQALEILPAPRAFAEKGLYTPTASCRKHGDSYLAWAEAHYALGHWSEAQDALAGAQEMLETEGLPEDKARAAALAIRF